MFEDAAVADFLDVAEVHGIAARPRPGKAHVTDTSGCLCKHFRGNFGVGLPTDAVIGQKAIEFGIVDNLPAQQIDGRFAQNADRIRIEIGTHVKRPQCPGGNPRRSSLGSSATTSKATQRLAAGSVCRQRCFHFS